MTRDLILGTAGHIDHGKTSLGKALTGIDCDRLLARPHHNGIGVAAKAWFALEERYIVALGEQPCSRKPGDARADELDRERSFCGGSPPDSVEELGHPPRR